MITRTKLAGVANDIGWYAFGWGVAAGSMSTDWRWAFVCFAFPVLQVVSWALEFRK